VTAEELERRIVAAGYHVTLSACVDANTAAAALELSPRTLVNMRQEGTGPEYQRLNGRIWYPVEASRLFEHCRADNNGRSETQAPAA